HTRFSRDWSSDVCSSDLKGTVLAYGPTSETFTRENLELAFGGVLRHFTLGGDQLHDDEDARHVVILTDDERPLVHYADKIHTNRSEERREGKNVDISGCR